MMDYLNLFVEIMKDFACFTIQYLLCMFHIVLCKIHLLFTLKFIEYLNGTYVNVNLEPLISIIIMIGVYMYIALQLKILVRRFIKIKINHDYLIIFNILFYGIAYLIDFDIHADYNKVVYVVNLFNFAFLWDCIPY
jgi:hypothetical protein